MEQIDCLNCGAPAYQGVICFNCGFRNAPRIRIAGGEPLDLNEGDDLAANQETDSDRS